MDNRKTDTVKKVGKFIFFGGVLGVIYGTIGIMLMILSFLLTKSINFSGLGGAIYLNAIVSFFMGTILIIAGRGVCQLKSWGRKIVTYGVCPIYFMGFVFSILNGSSNWVVPNPFHLAAIFSLICCIYFSRPKIKELFNQ